MIVIVLMGILAAIAIPMWWGLIEGRNVDSATNQVVSDLRLAHTRSTNQLTEWAVVQDLTTLSVSAGLVPSADYYLVRIPNPPAVITANDITRRYLPDGTRIDTTAFNVRFSPRGSVEPIGVSGMTVTVGSDDGDVDSGPEHEIELTPTTSKVEIVS
jgi:type II secretory pathway pseudopilin PulG